ncbi:cupin-like domain-containing protein [Chryseobacterium pennipullorum]|uniref:Cupin-like domain-containing protein n=1 Tax=Chryseobacterium pennipullorum TaxID=2258963 RepID=A0A3D9B238_9FLAO|nr:cupin-like domain-containing protein [Chryseobacterium pennipullorum]REC47684.1 cupin-like domain-containing protein [Chryseobacterium pennipullorum]
MILEPIEKIKKISSENFIRSHMKPRLPIILENFADPESPAFEKWNYNYFRQIAGDHIVNIYGSELESLNRVASPPIAQTTFSEYLDLIESRPTEHRLFLFNLLSIKPDLKKDISYNDLTGGRILKWLPFMFFGGQGSVTRNHIDIDMSHVFITQFQGIKRIWLFPREQSDLLYKLPYNFHSLADIKNPDYTEFPGLLYVQGYEAVLHPGETLYIPSGWWHYIQYETEGYSVSVRALPASLLEKWNGFKNLVITKNFDQMMHRLFKETWFNYKGKKARLRGSRAARKHRSFQI